MDRSTARVTVEPLGGADEDLEQMVEDLRAGLLARPKDLSPWPKYLYDARGSELFEEITTLPEYYQTRTELSILKARVREIVARSRCRELIELGSGSASKTRAMLDALLDAREEGEGPVRYVPLDVSESALRGSAERLLGEYPTLEISGYIGDFDLSLEPLLVRTREDGLGRLVIFLGGTIGNFTPDRRRSFLERLRSGLERGDHLLVGVDLVKDPNILKVAYDDSSGVTARFNKNLLNVLNYKLGGEFDPDLFTHRAVYDPGLTRVEMWLDSEAAQRVPVSALGVEVPFEEGEGMRTEISTKFTRESAGEMFEGSGFELLNLYTDPDNLFGLAFGRPA